MTSCCTGASAIYGLVEVRTSDWLGGDAPVFATVRRFCEVCQIPDSLEHMVGSRTHLICVYRGMKLND